MDKPRNMKNVIILSVILVFTQFVDAAKNYADLKMQLTNNPQLRSELIKAAAKITGKSVLSEQIEISGNLLETMGNLMNSRPFGIELTTRETVELLLLSLNEAPRPDKIVISKYFKSNGDLNMLITALRVLKKLLSMDDPVDESDLTLIVQTTQGKVRGKRVEENGVKFVSFLNIPYATLPKRFMAPKPPKPWKGIRNSFNEKAFCPQRLQLYQQISGVEDCLQLNIHVPYTRARNLPVFVWVHGGGFNFGAGSAYLFPPGKIVEQRLIDVSFHYRLGALGFLSTGTRDAPGNAGMKDMVAALRWIKANIKNFGGDPDNITLYGVSSGAIAIEYLLLSPMAKGLFTRVIMSSGSVFNEWAYTTEPLKYAFRLGKELGSNATHVKDLVKFLRKVNPLDIVKAQEKISIADNPSTEYIPFVPCVEEDIPGEVPFLSDHPENIMRSRRYTQIPAIVTFTDMEGLQLLHKITANPNYIFSIEKNLEYYLPRDILDGLNYPWQKRDILNKIRQFYFNGQKVGNSTVLSVVNLLSDSKFLLGVYKSAKLRTETSTMPTFYAEFAFDGDLNAFKYYNDIGIKGVSHADEIGYVFTLPFEKIYSDNNATSKLVAKRYITMFVNFAKYGHPLPRPTQLLPVNWYPIQSSRTYDYLKITDKLEMRQNPNQQRYAFWDALYRYKKYLLYLL